MVRLPEETQPPAPTFTLFRSVFPPVLFQEQLTPSKEFRYR